MGTLFSFTETLTNPFWLVEEEVFQNYGLFWALRRGGGGMLILLTHVSWIPQQKPVLAIPVTSSLFTDPLFSLQALSSARDKIYKPWVVVGGEESSSLFFFLARLFSEKNENKNTVELPLSDQLRHV